MSYNFEKQVHEHEYEENNLEYIFKQVENINPCN